MSRNLSRRIERKKAAKKRHIQQVKRVEDSRDREGQPLTEKKQRRMLSDFDRSIAKLADSFDDDTKRHDTLSLLTEMNVLGLLAVDAEDESEIAPDGWVKVFGYIRKLLFRMNAPVDPTSADAHDSGPLFQNVNRLFGLVGDKWLVSAQFNRLAKPEREATVEKWLFLRLRDLKEPQLGSGFQFRQSFLDRFKRFDAQLILPNLGVSSDDCVKLLDRIFDVVFARLPKMDSSKGPSETFMFSANDLVAETGLARDGVQKFLTELSYNFGDVPASYKLPTDRAETKPFLHLKDDIYYVLDLVSLFRDFYLCVEVILDRHKAAIGGKLADKVYAWRGKVVPSNVERCLAGVFGQANIHSSLYYDFDAKFCEGDLLIRCKDSILLCEVKGHEIIRDPSEAFGFDALESEFKTIQKGYDQCARTHKYIAAAALPVRFFDGKRKQIKLELSERPTHFYYLVVTGNSFGDLAGDCREILRKDDADPFPVIVSEFELSTILTHIDNPETFLKYLGQRSQLHGHIKTNDELEVAGLFLLQGTLEPQIEQIKNGTADMIMSSPDLAKIFNRPPAQRTSSEISTVMVDRKTLGLAVPKRKR